jgi:hypothetical protein
VIPAKLHTRLIFEKSVKVKCLAAPCKHTAVRFAKDVQVLRDVVRSETSEVSTFHLNANNSTTDPVAKRTVISRSWVEEGDDRQKNVFINVDCGPYTKVCMHGICRSVLLPASDTQRTVVHRHLRRHGRYLAPPGHGTWTGHSQSNICFPCEFIVYLPPLRCTALSRTK